MLPVDHLYLFVLFLVLPVYGGWAYRRFVARVERGEPPLRRRLYAQTMVLEWAQLATLVVIWLVCGRAAADVGLVAPAGKGFWLSLTVAAAVVAFLLYGWRAARRMDEPAKKKQRQALGSLVYFLPVTHRDYRHFVLLSITAGICEEIIYRGYVLWYLMQLMPGWAAILVSALGFAVAHNYQGISGMLRVFALGVVFAVLYVASGSIWVPILLHALVDILQGAALLQILRKDAQGDCGNDEF